MKEYNRFPINNFPIKYYLYGTYIKSGIIKRENLFME